MGKLNDFTGKSINGLTVIERVENFEGETDSRVQYLVICDCGNKFKTVARYLTRNKEKGCRKCNFKKKN